MLYQMGVKKKTTYKALTLKWITPRLLPIYSRGSKIPINSTKEENIIKQPTRNITTMIITERNLREDNPSCQSHLTRSALSSIKDNI